MIPALAPSRCWCNAHDVGLACPAWRHEAYRRDRKLREAECEFIGVQREAGFRDLALFNCHCMSTFSVLIEDDEQ